MQMLNRAPNEKELEKLRKIYLKAETDIINEIGRLRSMGNVDYHAVAALERVQAILKNMENECWEYVPKMIEKQFYVRVPEARKIEEPVSKHVSGYANAVALTAEQYSIIDSLVSNLMGEIVESENTVMKTLESALVGRRENDIFRRAGLNAVANMQARGTSIKNAANEMYNQLIKEGVTAFVDKAGRRWGLHAYCTMATRTTSRQSEVLAVLTADDRHDLYEISSHGTTCAICAPLEGRVYSKSGNDPDFPPLASAFGKVDPNGPDSLTNSYLNIHPNCLHVLTPWTPMGLTEEEVQKVKDFSSFKKNPPTKDPRTQEQIEAYRKKQTARAKWLRDYRQWEKYRIALGDKVPKTFETFRKHKLADDEKYKKWEYLYRNRKQLLTNAIGREIIKVEQTKIKGFPNIITQVVSSKGGISRNYYDSSGRQIKQISNNGHGHKKEEELGMHGEHAHDYIYDENGKLLERRLRELNSREREENQDIL